MYQRFGQILKPKGPNISISSQLNLAPSDIIPAMTSENELKFLQQPEVRGISKELILDLKDILNKFG